ncbi:MAG: peptidoglycan-binding protein [Clostridia bacterium]|nr:peptidoglycan-binding protein [Clostridia bacterium]
MAKRTLSYGSSGEEVKELQKSLNNMGYSLDVDGKFGTKTQNAVKSYQKNNGLSVDGIVGNNTWASLLGSSIKNNSNNENQAISTSNTTSLKQQVEKTRPTYQKSDSLVSAEKTLAEWEQNKPSDYNSKYSEEIERVLDSILNREKFNYNLNADPLYNQYKEQYVNNGKKAMLDTVADLSALTGGYANSYAVSAGNQSYNNYLNNLNEIALDLYDRAYSAYKDEGNFNKEKIDILNSLEKADYDQYTDSINDYYKTGEYLLKKLSNMSESEYEQFLTDLKSFEDDRDYNYQKYLEEVKQNQFLEELNFKKAEAERDQQNKDRSYNLSLSKSNSSSNSSNKSNNKTTETKTTIMPKTYQQFVYLTGNSGILTESEFYSKQNAKKEYGSYENYIKEMYYKYSNINGSKK